MLHARVEAYEAAWCDVLYERRDIFETTNKALSFILAERIPVVPRERRSQGAPSSTARPWRRTPPSPSGCSNGSRRTGPLSSADFERESGATENWFGVPENAVRSVLEAYTVAGVIGLARRDGNRRYYDILERLFPPNCWPRRFLSENSSCTSSSPATARTGCSARAGPAARSRG